MASLFSRNNYYRTGGALLVGFVAFWVFPLSLPFLLALAVVSLVRGVYRDVAAVLTFRRSPTAAELHAISRRSGWPERRGRLLYFPCSVSDRDEKLVMEGQSLRVPDPPHAMSVIGSDLERKALASFGDSVRCFQLRRSYDNHPKGQLYPLAEGARSVVTSGARSGQSLCFCQMRRDNFLPYLVLVYVHAVCEGQWIRAYVYVHGFSFSTWFGEDDKRLKNTTLAYAVVQMWNEAFGQYIQNSQQGAPHAGTTTGAGAGAGGARAQQGRTTR